MDEARIDEVAPDEEPDVMGFTHDVKIKGTWQQCNDPKCTHTHDHGIVARPVVGGATFGIAMGPGAAG